MEIEIREVVSDRELKRFIRLPSRLFAADPNFVPPLELERLDALRPGKNPYFEHAEAQYFLGKSLLGLDRKVEGYSWLRRFLSADRRGGARADDAKKVVRDLEQRLAESPAALRKALEGATLVNQGQWAQGIEVKKLQSYWLQAFLWQYCNRPAPRTIW